MLLDEEIPLEKGTKEGTAPKKSLLYHYQLL